MFDVNEDLLDARHERSALWRACCAGEITYAVLLARMGELRCRFGDRLYERPGRGMK